MLCSIALRVAFCCVVWCGVVWCRVLCCGVMCFGVGLCVVHGAVWCDVPCRITASWKINIEYSESVLCHLIKITDRPSVEINL